MLLGTALSLLEIKVLPVANYLPALFLAPLFVVLQRKWTRKPVRYENRLVQGSRSRTGHDLLSDDGSTTFQSGKHGGFFAFHDLVHYAVETALGYQHAFWAMIAGEWISETSEARAGPQTLGSITMRRSMRGYCWDRKPRHSGELPAEAALLNPMLAEGCTNHDRPIIELSEAQWNSIVEVAQELHAQFRTLPPDGKLELLFPPSASGTIKR